MTSVGCEFRIEIAFKWNYASSLTPGSPALRRNGPVSQHKHRPKPVNALATFHCAEMPHVLSKEGTETGVEAPASTKKFAHSLGLPVW